MPTEVKNLIKTGMRNPHVVEVRTENQGIFASSKDDATCIKISKFDTFSSKQEVDIQI